jgi:hypothetical protein
MAISPWAKNQTSPTWTILMGRDNGAPMDLTNVTADQLSLVIYNSSFAQIGTGQGSFTIVNANPGIVNYAPATEDSATIGNLYLRVIVDFGGSNEDMSDYIAWAVQN